MIRKAFLLGAGLGTRLRPLTNILPKPLVPLYHKPLIEWAMENCESVGIQEFAINTHHLPEEWLKLGGDWKATGKNGPAGENGVKSESMTWRNHPVDFFHEPELLETGGGIRNIRKWIGDESILVHNGDIYSSMPIKQLIEAHETSGNLVTMALRSTGIAQQVAVDGGQVVDIRETLGVAPGTHMFSGIYCLSPELIDLIPAGKKISVIPAFLELARQGKLGGITLDEGHWYDLGTEESYLRAHRELNLAPSVHNDCSIGQNCDIMNSAIGPNVTLGANSRVHNSVVWPEVDVPEGSTIESTVYTGKKLTGASCTR